jgi:hypothetical protein
MLPRLFLFAQIMTVWMMVDALRRKADKQWYVIILLPFGEWFYFFSVKIHDPSMARVKAFFKRTPKTSLDDLRRDAHRTPSARNRLRYAQGLFDAGNAAEAEPVFTQIIEREPTHKDALYGAGLARIELGDLRGAIKALHALVEQDPSFADFAAWLELADLLWKTGGRAEAVDEMEALIKRSPRARHRVTLAHYLIEYDKPAHARMVLERAIDEHGASNAFESKRDAQWITRAKRMLIDLG